MLIRFLTPSMWGNPGDIVEVEGETGIAGGVADVLVRRGLAEYVETMAVKQSKETATKKFQRNYKDGPNANNSSH